MHDEIRGSSLRGKLVSAAKDDRFSRAKIAARRRRRNAPLERRGAPRIAVFDLVGAPKSPNKIEEEKNLRGDGENRGEGNEGAERRAERCAERRGDRSDGLRIGSTAVRHQAEPVHGHEDAVDTGKSDPEVQFAERLVEAATKHFWKPEKSAPKMAKVAATPITR